jgi:hypothetical protein
MGQLDLLAEALELETDLWDWWQAHRVVGVIQRMIAFFREVLLKQVNEQVVIFVDEIDTSLSLPFAGDYFAAIRSMYNLRATMPEFNRLSFVLTGVATPAELSSDPRRTPFNIGETVNLDDFTIEEAIPLAAGFNLPSEKARQVLGWVLEWSGGHPFLTQRICHAVAAAERNNWTEIEIENLIRKLFLDVPENDSNLLFVRDMLTHRTSPELDRTDLMLTYRDVLRGRPVADDGRSRINEHLKLSGVVKRTGGKLSIRNPIYRKAFDERWVNKQLPPRLTLKRLLRGLRQ